MIYLLRHGESEWNVAGRTQGQATAPGLTELGRQHAQQAVATLQTALGGAPITRVISSDLTRALETAQIVAAAFGGGVTADSRLRERSLGSLEGLAQEEAHTAVADLDWSDPDLQIAGGESTRELYERMAAAMAELASEETVVAVSHGDAIRAAIATHTGHRPGDGFWVDVPNGAVAQLAAGGSVRWLPPAVSSR
jgi:broad specificity phosphatase PhoE